MKIDIFNTNKRYQIIYADPPWSYNQHTGRGVAANHYDTMTLDDICALPINNIKTDDAVLFMWATFPNYKEALKVMEVWGFEYKTAAFVWIKKNKNGSNFWGMGAYTRANAEVCLIGVSKKTKAKQLVKSHSVHQVIEAIKEQHSKKPDITYQKIEQLCGGVRRVSSYLPDKLFSAGTAGVMKFRR